MPKVQSRTYAYSSQKLATQGTQDQERQNKNTTPYVLDTTTGICKQAQAM